MVLDLGALQWEAAPGRAEKLPGGQQKGCAGNRGRRASLPLKGLREGGWKLNIMKPESFCYIMGAFS